MKIVDDPLCADGGARVAFQPGGSQGRPGRDIVVQPALLAMHRSATESFRAAKPDVAV